jgi:hypothetical protein
MTQPAAIERPEDRAASRRSFRLRTRSLVLLTAIVAVVLGTFVELRNQLGRLEGARLKNGSMKEADRQERLADECLRNEGVTPYKPADRTSEVPPYARHQGSIKTWAVEAAFHRKFAAEARAYAERMGKIEESFRRKLLFR